ncbi:VTC domain-containing protein [Dipodascopsis uninucleata]
MIFGVRLASERYGPWSESYIDYGKLKRLLKEDDDNDSSTVKKTAASRLASPVWTEADESKFVEALDAELEKVYAFESHKYADLKDRVAVTEAKMPSTDGDDAELAAFEKELDSILEEAQELEKFTRLNYTGFFKIVKKHDRLYNKYTVRPLLLVRLAALPFNSENYSPILYKLSTLYTFLREQQQKHIMASGSLDPSSGLSASPSTGATTSNTTVPSNLSAVGSPTVYKSFKFWVHPDNLMEVKTFILRHLPLLIYNPQSSKIADISTPDPTITTLYFDNPDFSLYLEKLESRETASSLRLRWYGKLNAHPEIFIERKYVDKEDPENVLEQRIPIKEKYVKPFIDGSYSMEKSIRKMRDRNVPKSEVEKFEKVVHDIQDFIRINNLQPVLRAVYSRTAFQIPDDDRVRISIDDDIDLIREDSFDATRPVRDPDDWHRRDIDDIGMVHPFKMIRKGEISRFPYAVLDIKVAMKQGDKRIRPSWVKDLMSSHLVKEAPKFSKFAHGVAMLFDDEEYINVLPYWLSELERDIRRDPEQAYAEELNRKKFGDQPLELEHAPTSATAQTGEVKSVRARVRDDPLLDTVDDIADEDEDDDDSSDEEDNSLAARRRNAKKPAKTLQMLFSKRDALKLPPGVQRPKSLLRQRAHAMVEPKVWLANERTFNKWLQVTVLLSALTFGLYNAAGHYNTTAHRLAYAYFILTIFTGSWGYGVYMYRLRAIQMRSGKHLDSPLGPIVVCMALLGAIILNYRLS